MGGGQGCAGRSSSHLRFPLSHAALTSIFPDISRTSKMSSLSCVLSALHGQLTWRTCFLSVEGPLFPHHKKEGENLGPTCRRNGKRGQLHLGWSHVFPTPPHPTPSHPSLTTDYEKGLAFQSGLLWLKDMRVLCELCGRLFLPLDPQPGSLVDPSSALSCSPCPGVSREGRSPGHRGWYVLLSGQTIWGMRFQAQAGDKSS